jgi:glycosyltransferase involved in cell wall biosynthesis
VPGAAADLRIDLVVATVERTDELASFLHSLDAQTHRAFRLILVDQNTDDRVARLLEARPTNAALLLTAPRGLSRARNAALPELTADVVAFPDDDCLYPPDLLARVAGRFAGDPGLDGLSGRPVASDGSAVGRWLSTPATITPDTVWHTANSHTIFLRRELVAHAGTFDEALGLGSGTPWSSGEEIDYLVRALRAGARIEYDPSLVITHPVKRVTPDQLVALGRRDGGSVGYVLARNHYPARAVARMLVRPAIGALVSLALLDTTRARFYAATLGGRLAGLRAGRRAR